MQAAQSTETWQRMWAVYHEALEQPVETRVTFVRGAAGDDASLQDEVLSLLESHDRAGEGFLDRPRLALAEPDDEPEASLTGRRVGRYLVGRMLAEGGSAVVYEAQQFDPPKAVALKVIRRGLSGRRAQHRFEVEAEILARLNHPGIAQVYEAGSFDLGEGGHSYFAMELVRGERLTDFAAARQLDARARVQLMIDVCDAVQHAHLRGVVHRDLKPSNILVEATGEERSVRVKVLDFGVAQMTDGDIGATRATAVSEVAGTLPYMSPEQAGGDARAIDARSDVYALGVLSYEMLSGRLPLTFASASLFEAIRIVREQEPPRLGEANPQLRGDLELVVHKAMEKDSSLRYQSAADLGADLRRWLNREPIVARRATRRYRLTRFAQRNKALVIGMAIAAAALLAGATISTWQAVQARRAEQLASKRAENARALAASVIEKLQNTISSLPETTAVRAELLSESIRFLDDISNEFNDDPDLLLMAGQAHERMGRVLGTPRGASLNDTAGSIKEFERSLACLAAAAKLAPERTDIVRQEGFARMGLTDALRADHRADEALQMGLQSAAAFGRIVEHQASSNSLESVGMYRLSAEIALDAGRKEVADDAKSQARMVLDSLREPAEDALVEQMYLGRTWAEFGRLLLEAGEEAGALSAMQRAEGIITVAASRGAEKPMALEFTIDAIRTQFDALLTMGRFEEARQVAARCGDLCEELLRDKPRLLSMRGMLALARRHESEANIRLGEYVAAIELARQSLAQFSLLREVEPNAGYYRGTDWMAHIWLLETLVSALENSQPDSAQRTQWLAESQELVRRIEDLERETTASSAPTDASAATQADDDSLLGRLRSRLEAVSR